MALLLLIEHPIHLVHVVWLSALRFKRYRVILVETWRSHTNMLSHVIAQRIVVTRLHIVTTCIRSHLKMHLLSIVGSVLLIILQTRLRLRKHICIDAIVTVTCTTVHTKTISKLVRWAIATLVVLLPPLKHRLIADHHPSLHCRRTALMILMQVAARVTTILLPTLP